MSGFLFVLALDTGEGSLEIRLDGKPERVHDRKDLLPVDIPTNGIWHAKAQGCQEPSFGYASSAANIDELASGMPICGKALRDRPAEELS